MFDRRFITLLLIVFVQMVGGAMVLPLLPLYAQSEFNLPPEFITPLVSSFFAAQFLAGPYIGRYSDQYGRVPVLIISQLGTVLSYILMAFAGSPWLLLFGRVLDGITGGNLIVAQAYVTDVTPPEKRTQALGYLLAALGTGFIFGPAFGGIMAALAGPRVPFLIAAGAVFVVTVMTWLYLDETVTREPKPTDKTVARTPRAKLTAGMVYRNEALVLILLVVFGGQFAFGLLQSTFALYGEAVLFADSTDEATQLGVGLLLAAMGVGQFITQAFLLRPALKRFPEAALVILGTVARGVSLFLLAVLTSPYLAALAMPIFALGVGFTNPPLQTLATRAVPDGVRGAVLGVYQSAFNLGIIFSTMIAGVLFGIAPTLPYWLGGVLFMGMAYPSLRLWRWTQRPDSAMTVPIGGAKG